LKQPVKNIIITGMMLGLGLLLPSFFHLFGAGPVFLPLHIPVFICALVCGGPYGGLCGALLPFLSSAVTGMPILYPTAIAMSFELFTYGIISGTLYRTYAKNIYFSMIIAMLAGRAVSGVANALLLGFAGEPYSLQVFVQTAFITGLPGIILQLALVPVLVAILIKAKLITKPVKQIYSA
jgi:hypothetical protein